MVLRSPSRRPRYRTRAYCLTRTLVIAVTLVVGGVRCAGSDEPAGPPAAEAAGHGGATASSGPAGADGGGRDAKPDRAGGDARDAKPDRAGGDARDAKPDRAGGDARGAKPHRAAPARPPRPTPPPKPLPRSPATSLRIPYFSLEAPVVGLKLDRERRLTTPPVDDPKLVGWYAAGPTPGESGTAVAVGHLDTTTGPAVFAPLSQLRPGRLVEVLRADGMTAVYTVDAVKMYEKAHFPNKEVYGDRGRPELRLITCGGAYDPKTGYAGNVVVFAHLTQTRGRPRTT
ncbi:class F sortase [Streptomyces lutosisoli]|uniref:Class F sortase n=1 Tax=Streptomyces lutosisoli TaxID=2665721 RepID=A0ABW2VMC1_9ACTN